MASTAPPAAADAARTRRAGDWRAIDFISDLHLSEQHAAHLRRPGRRTCAHAAPMRCSSSATCSRSGSATTRADRRLRGALRRGAGRRRPPPRRSASWPATATSWSAPRCSSACGVMRAARPDRARRPSGQRVLLTHGDALCLGDSAYQRFRAPGAQRRRGSATSCACRWPTRERLARADARRQRGRQARSAPPPTGADVDAAAARGLDARGRRAGAGPRPHPPPGQRSRWRRASRATC